MIDQGKLFQARLPYLPQTNSSKEGRERLLPIFPRQYPCCTVEFAITVHSGGTLSVHTPHGLRVTTNLIIGVDYHTSFQQIAFLDQETGECGERRLNHSDGETERFYRKRQQRGVSVRVGIRLPQRLSGTESSGRWEPGQWLSALQIFANATGRDAHAIDLLHPATYHDIHSFRENSPRAESSDSNQIGSIFERWRPQGAEPSCWQPSPAGLHFPCSLGGGYRTPLFENHERIRKAGGTVDCRRRRPR
jgi:hypothetical protein